jgi:hypothetical protein
VRKRLQYGSFASSAAAYLFIETPKAACSTMKWALALLNGGIATRRPIPPESTLAMCVHNRRLHPVKNIFHLSDENARHILTSDDVVRFCVVRNPYARFVSAWSDKIRQLEPGYTKFCRKILADAKSGKSVDELHDPKSCNHHWQEMKHLLMPDAIAYTHVLKTETLARDLAPILARIAPDEDAKTLLRSASTNESLPVAWKQHYDERLADAVYAFYHSDFEFFGYERDSWRQNAGENAAGPAAEEIERRALMAIRGRNEVIGHLYDRIDELSQELKQLRGDSAAS